MEESELVDNCLRKLHAHLSKINQDFCNAPAVAASGSDPGRPITLQVISERDALRLTFPRRHGQSHPLGTQKSSSAVTVFSEKRDNVEGGEEIFTENMGTFLFPTDSPHATDTCLVLGSAGQGKTTLCRQVIRDIMEAPVGPTSIIFYIDCSDVDRIMTMDLRILLGLNHPDLGFGSEEQDLTLQHFYLSVFAQKGQRQFGDVLVVFDGIEKAPADAFGLAFSLLISHPGCELGANKLNILVTACPCAPLYDFVPMLKQRYRLRRLTDNQLREACYLQLGTERGKQCMKQLLQLALLPLKEAICEYVSLRSFVFSEFSLTSSVLSSFAVFFNQHLCSGVDSLEEACGKKFGNLCLTEIMFSHMFGGRMFATGDVISVQTALLYNVEAAVCENDPAGDLSAMNAMDFVSAMQTLSVLCLEKYPSDVAVFSSTLLSEQQRFLCKKVGLIVDSLSPMLMAIANPMVQEWLASKAVATSHHLPVLISAISSSKRLGSTFWRLVFGALKPVDLETAMVAVQRTVTNACDRESRNVQLSLMHGLLENVRTFLADPRTVVGNRDRNNVVDVGAYVSIANMLSANGVDMEGVNIDPEDIMALFTVLQFADHVTALNVSRCNLSSAHSRVLKQVLDKSVEVNLSGNRLSGVLLENIGTALSTSTQPYPQIVSMRESSLTGGAKDGAALAKCVEHCSVTELYLTGSGLGNVGLASFVASLTPCDHLTSLSLANCNLQSSCGSNLATLLAKLPCLESLWLHDNALCDEDVTCMLTALAHHSAIQNLFLENNQLTNNLAADIIDCFESRRNSSADITDEHDGMACDAIMAESMIYLNGNDVTVHLLDQLAASGYCGDDSVDIGSHLFTRTLIHVVSAQQLVEEHDGELQGMMHDFTMSSLGHILSSSNSSSGGTDITTLDIEGCRITNNGVMAISSAGLSANTTLSYISVYGNKIQSLGAALLLQALSPPTRVSATLRALDLGCNPIFKEPTGNASYHLLLEALALCRQLRFLSLSDTGMTDEIGIAILQCFKTHAHIGWLDMSCNRLGDGAMHALADAKDVNSSLKLIALENNHISDAGLECLIVSDNIMAMDGVHLYANVCSTNAAAMPPPLFNTQLPYNTSTVLQFVCQSCDPIAHP
ncbi:uncharacterized protein LOC135830357 [Sycon ciliatum]|uniref:uncharacterized protein LOC135830357 n=1 Tax=Sycon ciliatum TaxID=27933 RepID=UPI0031F69EC6